jgi:Flp pilus assembly pilin Flp
MREWITTLVLLLRHHTHRGDGEKGATAIEWAIFALLAIAVAGLVAGAITLAVNNRLPGIQ